MAARGATPSDEDLFRLLRSGDEAAFTTLYRRWQSPLYRYALRMTGSTAFAEDVIQETFMALIHGNVRYDPARGSVPGYLYGIARNQVLRRLRRERPYVALEEPLSARRGAATASSDQDPLSDLTRRDELRRLREAIAALPEHYREALILCDLQSLSYEDAAQALGCALGTVRSRLHRGRELLAQKLRHRATAKSVGGALRLIGGES